MILAYDDEGSAAVRDRELDGHLEYIEKHCDHYLVCGPLRHPGSPELIGSFFLVSAEDAGSAKALVSDDPYVKSGMYRDIVVHDAVASGGRFMGGVIWESAEAIRARGS